ncbi:hypothetical protein CYY_009635, partial [Polysphondylium violaceum]
MSESYARSKQFEYKANSNLVIHSERNINDLKEPKGEPETLWGKLRGQMGDRVNYSKPAELLEKMQTLKRKNNEKLGGVDATQDTVVPSKKSKGTGGGGGAGYHHGEQHTDVLSATESFQGLYRPKTRETRVVYDKLLTFINGYIGDHTTEIIKGAADEIIAILKNDLIRAPEKKTEISKLLKGMSEEKFADLTNLGKAITDYKDQSSGVSSGTNLDSLDDTQGVAVVIDEDEDEENLSDFEIRDESDDDDNEDVGKLDSNNNDDDNEDKQEEQENMVDSENHLPTKTTSSDSSIKLKEEKEKEKQQQSSFDKSLINPLDIDAFWIQRKISTFEQDPHIAQKLAEQVLDILRQQDSRKCENDLVGLFDFSRFDFIKLLLNNKSTVLYCTLLAKSENEQERKKIEDEMSNDPILYTVLNQIKGIDIKGGNSNSKNDGKKQQASTSSTATTKQEEVIKKKKILNLDELSFQQGSHLMTNKNFKFPKGSKREQHKGYEEIHVPAKANPPFLNEERLIKIEEMPEWSHKAFAGLTSLNRVQSRLYEWAFKSNDNLLLSAPTSAGKTNVAMLTILHEIGKHIDQYGNIDRDAFKIVYIAPMKSLVQEMVGNFSKRLEAYNIVVKELTGDQSLT